MLLIGLFAGLVWYSLHQLDRQQADDQMLRYSAQLQLIQQQMTMQAMNYRDNAPRDYDTYYRDVRLYYQDLLHQRDLFEQIIHAFATNNFDDAMADGMMSMAPELDKPTRWAASQLEVYWTDFSRELSNKLGPNNDEPRLEWAAEWILDQQEQLSEATNNLLDKLHEGVAKRANQASLLLRGFLLSTFFIAAMILLWFYLKVLTPLNHAVSGFRQVATGDFSHTIPTKGNNEIDSMIGTFNQLSGRLHALLQLLTQLQQGKELEQTITFVAQTLPKLIPIDWISLLTLGPDGRMQLRYSLSDGKPTSLSDDLFELPQTLLQECLKTGKPIHIDNAQYVAALDEHYLFLQLLADQHRNDVIFVPIVENQPVVAVVVFAARNTGTFHPEHMALLDNLAQLLSLSLGRTLQLAESRRLAAIGQFASGIVHEIRNPLATISLALEHFLKLETLPASAQKRADLASNEVARLTRLLEEILLYAKPLLLNRQPIALQALLKQPSVETLLQHPDIRSIEINETELLLVDSDRIQQVLINLLKNALEANGGDPKGVVLQTQKQNGWLGLRVSNGGEWIEEARLEQIFEPFHTSKQSGTGLGLAIVKRIVEAHGGSVNVTSNQAAGTHIHLRLPLA